MIDVYLLPWWSHLTKWSAINWIYDAEREHTVTFQLHAKVAYGKRSQDYLLVLKNVVQKGCKNCVGSNICVAR